jgi:hypothetical protein
MTVHRDRLPYRILGAAEETPGEVLADHGDKWIGAQTGLVRRQKSAARCAYAEDLEEVAENRAPVHLDQAISE